MSPTNDATARTAERNDMASPELLSGRWYSTDELAALLGIDPSSVRRWRTSNPPQGPAFVRLSARVTIYSAADVESWLRSRRTDPRTDAA
jgi:predicted DNA-binding transcriptional regulator AlpA